MNVLPTIGRVLYALPFIVFGIMHFMNAEAMAGMVPFPPAIFWIYFTGLALIAAGVAISIQKMGALAALLLGVMLLIFALTIHLPGVMEGGDQAQQSMPNLLKDLSLSGAAFAFYGMFSDDTSEAA